MRIPRLAAGVSKEAGFAVGVVTAAAARCTAVCASADFVCRHTAAAAAVLRSCHPSKGHKQWRCWT